jgi:glucose/arabinose dehydrogenase
MNRRLLVALLLQLTMAATSTAGTSQPYVLDGRDCGGFPRVDIDMAAGYCAGLVVGTSDRRELKGLPRSPRMLLQLADGKKWLVSDLGRWMNGKGKIWMLEVTSAKQMQIKPLLTQLNLPHTLAFGPDGKVYVSEMGRIFRFDPDAADPAATIEQVIGDLPDNRLHEDRHPLPHFIFDNNQDLLVNIGAATDQCMSSASSTTAACEEDGIRAVIRRYPYLGDGHWKAEPEILARGLRNSMVLVRHDSGTLLQAENSYDFAPKSGYPYDEINVVRPGAHYGWPYCWDLNRATAVWRNSKAMDCEGSVHQKPVAVLPPHSAPLAATYYAGTMFPELRGKLLMSWHGYRSSGSRVVAIDVDSQGVPRTSTHAAYAIHARSGVQLERYEEGMPAPELTVLTPDWSLKRGVRPAGAPAGITVARDGALWIADDRNGAILRIAAERE